MNLPRTEFGAMGTLCVAAVTADRLDLATARAALADAQAEVVACERVLTRFSRDSDLARLNAAGGSWVEVDGRLSAALHAALRARESTEGRFDPTILPALAAAGYDRSFELLEARPPRRLEDWQPGAVVEVDNSRARVEAGAAVDLGGIAKGFAAERALAAMLAGRPELPGGLVDLGGDIALSGVSPEGTWHVAIADPRRPGERLGTLELQDGGVATSGRDTRRFGPGRALHHLIDPTHGLPARDGPLAVTVVALSATDAEANATALAVLPIAAAEAYLGARPHLGALLVPDVGEPVALGRLPLLMEAA